MLSKSPSTSQSSSTPNNPSSSGLKVHTISITHGTTGDLATTTAANNDDNNDASPEMKRPRSNSNNSKEVSFSSNTNTNTTTTKLTPKQTKLTAMATSVKDFLLLGNEENDSKPIDVFQGAGGVMYLVMSLVETRGIDRLHRGEFVVFSCCFYVIWAWSVCCISLFLIINNCKNNRHGRSKHNHNLPIRTLQPRTNESPPNRSSRFQRI